MGFQVMLPLPAAGSSGGVAIVGRSASCCATDGHPGENWRATVVAGQRAAALSECFSHVVSPRALPLFCSPKRAYVPNY